MADLKVDVDGLSALGAMVTSIKDRLNGAAGQVDRAHGSMGSGTVCDALGHFEDHWEDGRKHLGDNADTMASMLSSAVDSFTKAENDLSTALTTNTTETTIGGGGEKAV
jgi:hypothetical protein